MPSNQYELFSTRVGGQPLRFGTSIPDDWYVMEPADADTAAVEIGQLALSHVLPLFEDLRDLTGFLNAFERSDRRILWHDGVLVAVVASYVILGRQQAAQSLAARRFNGPLRSLLPPRLAAALTT